MTKRAFSRGLLMDFTAPANLSSDDVLLIGAIFGVVQFDVASGGTGVLAIEGVQKVPAANDEAWSQGDRLYYDGTVLTVDDATGTLPLVAFAFEDKATSATEGLAKIGVIGAEPNTGGG